MPLAKFRNLSGRAVCQILAREGFSLVRQKGSHAVMQKRLSHTTITVPVPLHPEIKIGTLMSIIRQSGLLKSLFENC
ncbi:MAG: type II toxin-antitoxin system HicA family toxin [Fibrobacterota bacterium]